jgi:hypothetical protein
MGDEVEGSNVAPGACPLKLKLKLEDLVTHLEQNKAERERNGRVTG